jgi:site-specific DNA-methyltransferase (adenine-specific)
MEAFGKINLIHGDCMDYLRSLPDNAFSLACVDPPYGAGNQTDGGGLRFHGGDRWDRYRKRQKNGWNVGKQVQENGAASTGAASEDTDRNYPPLLPTQLPENKSCTGIDWDVAPEPEYFEQLFRVSKNQIIWGANYFPNMPPTRCFLVWRKLSISEKFSRAMAEYAWTSFNQNAKVFECAPQGKKNDPRFHPTAKPIELYAWIFNNFCKAGDTILDTHLGSGSSAIAAHQLGFDFTGIEIDDEYYEKAKERLLRYQAQLSLF